MSWYLMHRGWMDNSAFKPVPLTEREAWAWLIENAAYEDTVINIRGVPVQIKRGSLSHSVRFLDEAWQWKGAESVRRYLRRLENWGMTSLKTVSGRMLITISNYEKYQSPQSFTETEKCQSYGQKRVADVTDNKEGKENKELNEKIKTRKQHVSEPLTVEIPDWMPVEAFNAFIEHRKAKKNPVTTPYAITRLVGSLTRLRDEGHDPEAVINLAIERGWQAFYAPNAPITSKGGHNDGKSKSQQAREAALRGAI